MPTAVRIEFVSNAPVELMVKKNLWCYRCWMSFVTNHSRTTCARTTQHGSWLVTTPLHPPGRLKNHPFSFSVNGSYRRGQMCPPRASSMVSKSVASLMPWMEPRTICCGRGRLSSPLQTVAVRQRLRTNLVRQRMQLNESHRGKQVFMCFCFYCAVCLPMVLMFFV